MSAIQYLSKNKRPIIFAIAIGSCLLPVLFPLGIGTIPTHNTIAWYDVVKENEGQPVVWVSGFSLSTWIGDLPDHVAIAKTLMKHNAKIIMWSPRVADYGYAMERLMVEVGAEEDFGYEYGVDWVILGYRAGGVEVAFAAVSSDIKGAFPVDFRGNDINTLPIMEGIDSMADVPVGIFHYGEGPMVEMIMRQWWGPYEVEIIPWCLPGAQPESMAYVGPNKPIKGLLVGKQGTAELEVLTGFLGDATILQDAMGIIMLSTIILLAVSNYNYFTAERSKTMDGGT